jgi:outer membrane protein OmpA-like peptidoglycan-associated protein
MRKAAAAGLAAVLAVTALGAETFAFRQQKGDKYRILSQVEEEVYINGFYSHTAEILNRISLEIVDVREDQAAVKAGFQTSERASGSSGVYEWGRDYYTEFLRDSRGRYTIGPEYFMPVLRDIPVFPLEELSPGDIWRYPAMEVHDLRDSLGVATPYRFPIDVEYTYLGLEELQGSLFHAVGIRYTIFHRAAAPPGASPHFPVRITGISEQVLYWNSDEGRPEFSREEFDIFFDLFSGDSIEYRGRAEGRVVEAVLMNRQELADNIRRDLEERGVEEPDVQINDRGVTITLRNIQFPPDSAVLWASEKAKLDEICRILEGIADRDIEIAGHTALAGTEEGRYQLSLDRARAVGNYLLEQGCRKPDEIIIRGFGAQQPVADNATPRGQSLNRRVEITILEN